MKGQENVYTCQTCGGYTTTIDKDQGTTPFMIRCRAHPGCNGDAHSAFYPKGPRPPHIPAPAYEWVKPTPEEYAKLDQATREQHCDKGGLLMRNIATGKLVYE